MNAPVMFLFLDTTCRVSKLILVIANIFSFTYNPINVHFVSFYESINLYFDSTPSTISVPSHNVNNYTLTLNVIFSCFAYLSWNITSLRTWVPRLVICSELPVAVFMHRMLLVHLCDLNAELYKYSYLILKSLWTIHF